MPALIIRVLVGSPSKSNPAPQIRYLSANGPTFAYKRLRVGFGSSTFSSARESGVIYLSLSYGILTRSCR
jgi:hypothetical protein